MTLESLWIFRFVFIMGFFGSMIALWYFIVTGDIMQPNELARSASIGSSVCFLAFMVIR